jgi:hypothetical protein
MKSIPMVRRNGAALRSFFVNALGAFGHAGVFLTSSLTFMVRRGSRSLAPPSHSGLSVKNF